ncbi:SIR2 family protein [Burkholderia vietnamiensis]|uniref:SIR2 family protein n=1 Tax=Burkholderia vietnamiensis TaxID=60552 RepID=UPI00075D6637|nr:SIR2 family protein [Burkholderia vietnamiensis]MDN8114389.1 SIR2 family protein [Burkholderia vietnamiensis]QTK86461.1 SIR2 family protein [Burkholderia vietnamiensis]HDR8999899.1 SIR2 family protein [Burkholderia vietnamiensis]HDR9008256.1 SIR2 family protein [Burkholderia vietnamiensis]HDR9017564.1 SIR2 family protein [Burkholderia vietnamiensis]
MTEFERNQEELRKLLDLNQQYWLLGAGVSYESNIPLMYQLTYRVDQLLEGRDSELFSLVVEQLPEGSHVEHVLTHLGDLIAISRRVRTGTARLGNEECTEADLINAYQAIIEAIGVTVRYGYRRGQNGEADLVGQSGSSIVKIEHHVAFLSALFDNRSNLETRSNISFFTTNYDTLLEDALALKRRVPIDGFNGSAIGFWDPSEFDERIGRSQTNLCPVYKLHGSVDWVNDATYGLVRCRYDVDYLSSKKNLLIYPQATKYIETQKDPFAYLFSQFRASLASPSAHLLAVAGYSFGDDHINNEIDLALQSYGSKTNLVAFSKEVNGADGVTCLPPTLERWRNDPRMNTRVYVASDKALYWGSKRFQPSDGGQLGWWSFSGLTKFLDSGEAQ